MENNLLILVEHCCQHYNIEISFIDTLEEYGLISVTQVNEERFLSHTDLREIEKLMQFHYDLGINMEGIDVIVHLLQQIKELRFELQAAQNKLSVLEDDFMLTEV